MHSLEALVFFLLGGSFAFEMTEIFGVPFLLSKLMFILSLVVVIVRYKAIIVLFQTRSWYLRSLRLFILLLVIPHFYHQTGIQLIMIQNIMMMILALVFFKNRKVREAFVVGYFGGFFILVLMLAFGIGLEYNWEGRISVLGFNQNLLAINIVLSYFLFIEIYRKPEKLVNILLSLLLLIAVLKTGSRQGLVAYALLVGIRVYKDIGMLLSLGIGIFLLIIAKDALVWQRLMNTVNDGDSGSRMLIWAVILESMDSVDYIYGMGYDGFRMITKNYFGYTLSAHNAFIEGFGKFGLFGLGTTTLFLFMLTKSILDNSSLRYLMVTVIFLIFFVGHPLGTRIVWFLVPLLVYKSSMNAVQLYHK